MNANDADGELNDNLRKNLTRGRVMMTQGRNLRTGHVERVKKRSPSLTTLQRNDPAANTISARSTSTARRSFQDRLHDKRLRPRRSL